MGMQVPEIPPVEKKEQPKREKKEQPKKEQPKQGCFRGEGNGRRFSGGAGRPGPVHGRVERDREPNEECEECHVSGSPGCHARAGPGERPGECHGGQRRVSRIRLQYFREGEVELARPEASTRVCSYTIERSDRRAFQATCRSSSPQNG